MAKPSARAPRSILSSGLLTALSLAVVTGLSAAVGVVIAREFGRGVETDGFFAAYAVFLVFVLAASAVRVAVLPSLARARAAGTFGSVLSSYGLALALVAVPAIALGVLANDWTAELLAGGLPPIAQKTAADALVFLVPAAIAHLYAALAASGLAAFDSYGTAAAGYALGSVLGLAVILWRVDEDGIIACAWGPLVNGLVALTVPLIGLLLRADWGRRVALDIGSRFAELARATALPIVLQAFFVVCLRFVSGLGTGSVTSFTYAYFVAAALVAVTASSLGLVSSVPLTRAALSDERASTSRRQHVARLVRGRRGRRRRLRSRRRAHRPRRARAGLRRRRRRRDRPPDRAARPVDGGVDRRHDHVPDALRREQGAASAAARDRRAAPRRRR